MDVAIIIVSYNTKEDTRNCLWSVYNETRDLKFEVIVIDNGSTDGSREMIKQHFPDAKLIANSANKGFGAANNQGIKSSSSKYVFLLNSDTVLVNNAVKILFDFMEKIGNSNAGCSGASVYDENMSIQTSYGNFPSLMQVFFEQFELSRIFREYYNNNLSTAVNKHYFYPREVDYIPGSDMFIRKAVLDKIGLFDEDFFLFYEESELSYRIYRAGFKSFLVPDAKIIHIGGKSVPDSQRKAKWEMVKKSEMLFFKKRYGEVGLMALKTLYVFGKIYHKMKSLSKLTIIKKSNGAFKKDFEKITNLIKMKQSFVFARYADGENVLLKGMPIWLQTQAYQQDKWSSSGNNPKFRQALRKSTFHTEKNYYYAISCKCCDPEGHKFYKRVLRQTRDYLTFSNLFINANYRHFKDFVSSINEEVILLAHKDCLKAHYPFEVAEIWPAEEDCVNWYEKSHDKINDSVDKLASKYSGKLFFVAVGPLSEILIDMMYKSNPMNRYVDVGSALDEWTHGKITRLYQKEGSEYYNKVCYF